MRDISIQVRFSVAQFALEILNNNWRTNQLQVYSGGSSVAVLRNSIFHPILEQVFQLA